MKIIPSIGQRASTSEIRARWAYGEMRSPRFRRHFDSAAAYDDLVQKANAGVPFAQLTVDEQQRLVKALSITRNPEFASNLEAASDVYECKLWSEEDLMGSWALPEFNPERNEYCISFRAFLSAPQDKFGENDPRGEWERLKALGGVRRMNQVEPIIAIGKPGQYTILEGYFRCIAFAATRPSRGGLLAWIPVHEGASEPAT